MKNARFWLLALLLLMAAVLAGCARWQEMSDESRLREVFDIPSNAERLEFKAFHGGGFGQREGLRLLGRYRFTAGRLDAWSSRARAGGWQTLPFPDGLRRHFKVSLEGAPLDTARGLYLCRTAGDDILEAKKVKACDTEADMNDVRLGILDETARELTVLVAAGY